MALIDKETIRAEIERRMFEDYNGPDTEQNETAQGVCAGLLAFLDTLPEQPEPKPKAIVIRPAVNLQKELMGVSAEVKDAVMLLLKEGWSLKAPNSEREFDQRAVCAGFSSIPPSHKLYVKPEQHGEGLDKARFLEVLDKWEEHAIRGMRNGATAYHQGKIALIEDLRDWINGED